MGPCQGAFCTFRVAGLIAERLDGADGDAATADAAATIDTRAEHAATADRALTAFLRERFKGSRPIAHGRQLQELLHDQRDLQRRARAGLARRRTEPAPDAEEAVVDAAR